MPKQTHTHMGKDFLVFSYCCCWTYCLVMLHWFHTQKPTEDIYADNRGHKTIGPICCKTSVLMVLMGRQVHYESLYFNPLNPK